MSIITAWLSDLKLGVCSQGWWLNRKFCCWEMMDEATGACEDWHEWTHWSGVQWLVYVAFAVSRRVWRSRRRQTAEARLLCSHRASSPSHARGSSSPLHLTRRARAFQRSSASSPASSSTASSAPPSSSSRAYVWCGFTAFLRVSSCAETAALPFTAHSDRIGPLGGQGRAIRARRLLRRTRRGKLVHPLQPQSRWVFELLRAAAHIAEASRVMQTDSQDARCGHGRKCCRCRRRVWQSDRRRPLFSRGARAWRCSA